MRSSVYVLVDNTNNRVKIGKANDVKTRIKCFGYASIDFNESLEIVCDSERSAFAIEKMLHGKYDRHRLHVLEVDGGTEWFGLDCLSDIVEFIDMNRNDDRILEITRGLVVQPQTKPKIPKVVVDYDTQNTKNIQYALDILFARVPSAKIISYRSDYLEIITKSKIEYSDLTLCLDIEHGGYNLTPSFQRSDGITTLSFWFPTLTEHYPKTNEAIQDMIERIKSKYDNFNRSI